jgi:hypothetical protein
MAINQIHHRSRGERSLYTWVAVLISILVLIGFAPTYYLSSAFGGRKLSVLAHLHGVVMTSWIVLFIVQVRLVAAHRVKLHLRLGVFGVFLTVLVVVVGTIAAVSAAARGSGPKPPLVFLAIPLGDILVFAILAGTSLYFRRHPGLHKRLMLLAALSILGSAIARFPLEFFQTPSGYFGLLDLFVIGSLAYDTIRNHKFNQAFALGALLIIVSQPLRLFLSGTETWMQFAGWLVR